MKHIKRMMFVFALSIFCCSCTTTYTELKSAKQSHDNGELTDDEYDTLKSQILEAHKKKKIWR